MKTRNGFVSNSSSSSFVVLCPKDQFDNYIKKTHPFYKEWSKHLGLETQKFLEKECVLISCVMRGDDESGMEDYEGKLPKGIENYGDKEYPMFNSVDIMSCFIDELRKNCKDIIINEENV